MDSNSDRNSNSKWVEDDQRTEKSIDLDELTDDAEEEDESEEEEEEQLVQGHRYLAVAQVICDEMESKAMNATRPLRIVRTDKITRHRNNPITWIGKHLISPPTRDAELEEAAFMEGLKRPFSSLSDASDHENIKRAKVYYVHESRADRVHDWVMGSGEEFSVEDAELSEKE